MEPETSLDIELAAALERYDVFKTQIAELMAAATADRASADSAIAAKAQRALASATLEQTTPERAMTAATKQFAMTVKKSSAALKLGLAAAADMHLAKVRLQALRDAEDARQAEKSKVLADAGIPIEGQRLVRKLLKLGVSPSMFDLLTEPELEVMARLLWEKNDDYKHSGPGLWMAICRAGFVDFPVDGLTEDEAAAVEASTGAEEAFVAKRFLEASVGRTLDISSAFALALVKNHHASEKSRGLRLTGERIEVDNVEKDLQFILAALGLGDEHRARAKSLWDLVFSLEMEKFEQRRDEEAASRERLIDFYLPLARQVREHRARQGEAWRAKHPLQTEDDLDDV